MATNTSEEPTFGIGAVARMTGIPMDTLRVWERRYNTVSPRRTSDNRRYYTREDVARLTLIRRLVDSGHAIGGVAQLSDEALRERLQAQAELHATIASPVADTEQTIRLLVYGDFLPFSLDKEIEKMFPLNVIGRHSIFGDFERDALALRPDILVAEFPALRSDAVARMHDLAQRSGAKRTVLAYGFAPKSVLERLDRQGILALRMPVAASALGEACVAAARQGQANTAPLPLWILEQDRAPSRRFSGEALAAIARAAPRLHCECPKHMVDLVTRLGAFEDYSADCENRNAQDAMLHAHLRRVSGQARALLEEALARWVEMESLDLTNVQG